MKRYLMMACVCLAGLARGQNAAPPEVTASAVAAVQKLGKEVVQGHYQAPMDRMYPQWRDRIAKQSGGVDKLQAALEKMTKTMSQQGVSFISFEPTGAPTSFEVWPGVKKEMINGQEVQTQVFQKWMVLIPTQVVYRIVAPAKDGQAAQPYNITTQNFQIAVSDKGKNDWTFIDGSSVSIADLRSVFLSLPENLVLPEIKRSGAPK
jgi:hypothetical protein